jgi:PQQ-dependent catabolism-associated CXXCW motif protein
MRIIPLLAAALFLAAAAPVPVPEPAGLWEGPMHADTPAALKGATVTDAKGVSALIAKANPVLLDVAEAERKPPSMAADMPWMPTHRSIPGAIWLIGGGSGTGDPNYQAAFAARVLADTGKDLDRPIVVFCHPHCWGSWNAAKRAVLLGYHHVYWYRGGVEGWQQAGYDTTVVKPDADWENALKRQKSEPSKRLREGMQ